MSPSIELPGYAPGSWWYYAPNKAAPIVSPCYLLVLACGISINVSVFIAGKELVHYLGAQCSLWEALSCGRLVHGITTTGLFFYISSTVLLLCAPPIYEGANFFTLGRILYYVPYHSPIHPGRVVTTFSALQGIVEAFNGSGGARVANPALSAREQNIGKALLKTALILQLVCMACFVLLAASFEYRCRKAGVLSPNLRTVIWVLYASCLLITTRTVYRTVEWFQDSVIVYNDPSTFPPIFKHEWFFLFFEATLMVINSWLLNICHPSRYLPRNLKVYLSPDGVTEVEGRGFEDDRPFLVTLFDPFDLWGLITGRDKKNKIWSEEMTDEARARNLELGETKKRQTDAVDGGTPLENN